MIKSGGSGEVSSGDPLVRLCPVTRLVNTSGGHSAGGEGMEKDYVRNVKLTPEAQRLFRRSQIIYADPMDLTKMLNIPPGTQVLGGVGATQGRFYDR